MRSLYLLTKKNVKLLLRSKASALIIIFAPLLIILLLGLSYNDSGQYGLNIGVHSSSFTEDVNSFVTLLEEEEFTITKHELQEDCIDEVKRGTIHTCIILPDSLQISGNEQKEVVFHIDPSKVNIVWMIQETVKEKFNIKSQEISQSLAQDVLTRVVSTKDKINEKKSEVDALKEKTSSASSTTNTVKSSLTGLDLTAPTGEYDEAQVNAITTGIETAVTKIDQAITAVDNSNMTSSKVAIKKPLQDALKELTGSTDVNATGGVGAIVVSLKADLDLAKQKLSSAASAVESSNANLAAVSTALSESSATIDSVQAGLNEVIANIEGQKVTEAGTLVSPLTTKIEKVSEEGTFLSYLFPAILVLVIMFSSLLLGTTLVMMEKNSPAFLRNFFLPVRKTTFIISTYLTNLVLIILQIVIILGISLFFLKSALLSLPLIALILFIAASVFTFLGMLLGYLFISEETAILASISLGSVLLFISGTILPLEGISVLLRKFTYFNPFVIAEKLIREVFIFNSPITAIWIDLVILFGYAIILFIVILIMESILHKHLVHKFLRHHHRAHRQNDKKNKKEV